MENRLPEVNEKGEYLLWDEGKEIGYHKISWIAGVMVLATMKPILLKMISDAKKAGYKLTLAVGIRTFMKQYSLRVQNAPVDKKTDEKFLLTASPSLFKPETGKPGWSNHHDGKAHDFNVSIKDKAGKLTGVLPVFTWLFQNAHKYGFIRTIESEPWHWEYRPGKDRFSEVPMGHWSWFGVDKVKV